MPALLPHPHELVQKDTGPTSGLKRFRAVLRPEADPQSLSLELVDRPLYRHGPPPDTLDVENLGARLRVDREGHGRITAVTLAEPLEVARLGEPVAVEGEPEVEHLEVPGIIEPPGVVDRFAVRLHGDHPPRPPEPRPVPAGGVGCAWKEDGQHE